MGVQWDKKPDSNPKGVGGKKSISDDHWKMEIMKALACCRLSWINLTLEEFDNLMSSLVDPKELD